jgi:hypothetical protein
MKPREFIEVLDNPSAPSLRQPDPEGELLLTLLAHLFFADRRLDEGELALMKRLTAGIQDVDVYLQQLASRELDFEALAKTFPDPQDRDDIITLAEHAVWGDADVDAREWDIVDALVEKLGVTRP